MRLRRDNDNRPKDLPPGELCLFAHGNQFTEFDRAPDIFAEVPSMPEQAISEVLWGDLAITVRGVRLVPAAEIDEASEIFGLCVEPRGPSMA